jgi:hypothetical protein
MVAKNLMWFKNGRKYTHISKIESEPLMLDNVLYFKTGIAKAHGEQTIPESLKGRFAALQKNCCTFVDKICMTLSGFNMHKLI